MLACFVTTKVIYVLYCRIDRFILMALNKVILGVKLDCLIEGLDVTIVVIV